MQKHCSAVQSALAQQAESNLHAEMTDFPVICLQALQLPYLN